MRASSALASGGRQVGETGPHEGWRPTGGGGVAGEASGLRWQRQRRHELGGALWLRRRGVAEAKGARAWAALGRGEAEGEVGAAWGRPNWWGGGGQRRGRKGEMMELLDGESSKTREGKGPLGARTRHDAAEAAKSSPERRERQGGAAAEKGELGRSWRQRQEASRASEGGARGCFMAPYSRGEEGRWPLRL